MATYTQDQLTARDMTRAKLEAIAIEGLGINADVVRLSPNKGALVEMILQAQASEESDSTEEQEFLEEVEVVQVDELADDEAGDEEDDDSDDDGTEEVAEETVEGM